MADFNPYATLTLSGCFEGSSEQSQNINKTNETTNDTTTDEDNTDQKPESTKPAKDVKDIKDITQKRWETLYKQFQGQKPNSINQQ